MATNASSDWPLNRLLLALPARNLKRLMPELEQIRCQRAQVLMDADQPGRQIRPSSIRTTMMIKMTPMTPTPPCP